MKIHCCCCLAATWEGTRFCRLHLKQFFAGRQLVQLDGKKLPVVSPAVRKKILQWLS